jgi:coenzyme Q-binding protein COQ10
MPSSSVKKKISCTKKDLINMVLDIEKYPEFVPWCLGSKVHEKKNKGDTVEIIADLTIGKSFFKETYKSFVTYNKSTDTIYVTNMEGPLKHLENKWFFKDLGDSSEVEFQIDFELKNKILNLLMNKSFDLGLIKIADAFQKRAEELFNKT